MQNLDISNREIWDEKELAFLAFLDEVIDNPEARDETFANVQKWFDSEQIVEIIVAQVRTHLLPDSDVGLM